MKSLTVYSKERGFKTLKAGVTLETYRAKYPSAIKAKAPSIKTLEKWSNDGVCKTPCGCKVEQDGCCSHGNDSWLLIMGMI